MQKLMKWLDGSDEHTKDLRSNLASIEKIVDAQAISIKHLELQMAQLSLIMNPHQPGTLRSNIVQIPKNDGH